jgi:DNA processing protein
MARGIDTAAHTGALDAKGKTIAVLGCGADVIYPPESGEIYYSAIENGAVISELPAGSQPLAENFPVRTRIIAGMSRGTLIVESEEQGGTAITASMVASYGRDVFAVPGAPYFKMAALSNMLIRQGAIPVESAADILKFYGYIPDKKKSPEGIEQIQLDFLQRQIYNLLLQGDLSVESIAKSIEYPQSEINASLTLMEISGIIKRAPGGKYGI